LTVSAMCIRHITSRTSWLRKNCPRTQRLPVKTGIVNYPNLQKRVLNSRRKRNSSKKNLNAENKIKRREWQKGIIIKVVSQEKKIFKWMKEHLILKRKNPKTTIIKTFIKKDDLKEDLAN